MLCSSIQCHVVQLGVQVGHIHCCILVYVVEFTVLPRGIAVSPYSTRHYTYMYIEAGFPLYCPSVLPNHNAAMRII